MKPASRKAHTSPRIQPQAKSKLLTCSFQIDQEANDQLLAYAAVIPSDRSYVIREALKYSFRNDPSFQSHPHKCVPGDHDAES